MIVKTLLIIFLLLFLSCNKNNNENNQLIKTVSDFDDSEFVVDSSYLKGDSRRYGIYPEKPFSNQESERLIELADLGLELNFHPGIYYGNFIFQGVKDVKIIFDNAIIAGHLQIISNEKQTSENIYLSNHLTVLDKVFIQESSNIEFDTLIVKSDTLKNIYNKMNRGVSIYAGSKNIKIGRLCIYNTGGSSKDFFKFSAAALQVHGWNNNPEYISIDELEIENAGRTALYLTGNNHLLKKVTIRNFGLGSPKNMFGLEDSNPGDETEFSGAWINKCNNCVIDSLSIKNSMHKGDYSIHFGIGQYSKPSFINNVQFLEHAIKMPLKDDPLTNILVKKVY